ncbi:MAG: hypothetical protein JETCAE03_36090 [Ignavibacteriaceae bacterium]|jgi:hypothetical protein|nr:MAG: hypothetical protein JETCAE03_36090 [Ignavibacteriaceae bacterium]
MYEIIFILISGVFVMLAAIMNATMDVTDHKFAQTIFVDMFKKGFFNIPWNLWTGQDKMWLNKYNNRDINQGLREDKILFITANFVQLYDIWHFTKMWMIVFFILGLLFNIFWIALGFDITSWISWTMLVGSFIYYGLCWNVTFNLFYDKILLRKEFRK